MWLDVKILERLEKSLGVVDEFDTRGRRLIEDARRLVSHVRYFLSLKLGGGEVRADVIELGCYALQFPMQRPRHGVIGKAGRTSLRDRVEQAAELLVAHGGDDARIEEPLLDLTTRTLLDVPSAKPALEESKLLADAVNLDDFGLVGMLQYTTQLARQGDGVSQLLESARKREEYGYWDARLKDSFHFEPVRSIALKRLGTYRHVAKLLGDELLEHSS